MDIRVYYIFTALWISLQYISTNCSPTNYNSLKPNFVFILADDLGYGDVGYNGGKADTPNIDALARGQNSAQFNRFYSGSPTCSPTRGTLLTGRNHNRYCIWKANTPGRSCHSRKDFICPAQVSLPHSEITIAEILQSEGYKTAVFGKWHLGDLKQLEGGHTPSSPGDNGFEEWTVTERSVPTSTPNCACFDPSLCNLGHYAKRGALPCTNYHSKGANPNQLASHNEPILKDDSDFIVDLFENFLSERQEEKPFFVYLPLHGIHQRYIATSPYDSPYTNRRLTQKELDYYASITAVDHAVGRVRQLLRAHNLSDSTMLWFASDNGPAKNSPGETAGLRDRKGSLYEGGIRVPGIMEYPPLIKSNVVTDIPSATNDFLPTVCDLLHISTPNKTLDGESILRFLNHSSETQSRGSTIKWAYRINGDFNTKYKAAIIDGNYKLVADYDKGKRQTATLYDLSTADGEDTGINLMYNITHMKMYDKLTRELEKWRLSVQWSATSEVSCL